MRAPSLLVVAAAALFAAAGCGGGTPVQPGNEPPHIQGIVAVPTAVARLGQTQITVLASDAERDTLHYSWSAPAGVFADSSGPTIRWRAPDNAGTFRIDVSVSDGPHVVNTSVNIIVGSGTIFVTSDPPGFDILVDGLSVNRTTPDSLRHFPVSTYTISLGGTYFRFAPSETTVSISDEQVASVRFIIPPVSTELVDTGDAVDEIGGFAYTRLGLGVLYSARAGADTTLRSASLVPTHSGQNGGILEQALVLTEPVSVRIPGPGTSQVAYVKSNQIRIADLVDANNDGLVESIQNPAPLQNTGLSETYGPAFSANGGILGFGLAPSSLSGTGGVLFAGPYDSSKVTRSMLVTLNGNSLSFGRDPLAVYESGGEIYQLEIDAGRVWPAVKVTDTGGTARLPALSPDGRFVAYIDVGSPGGPSLKLLAPNLGRTVTLIDHVATSEVAWSPDSRELLIADNSAPGNARLKLVYNLPIQ